MRAPRPEVASGFLLLFIGRDYFSILTFLLQKKHRFRFDESDDEEMTDLLKVMTSPPSAVKRSFEAEEAGLAP